MSGIILPEWVAQNERKRRALEDASSGLAQTRYWNPLLREIDPCLQLVWVGRSEPEDGVVPYRWHLLRTSEQGLQTYLAITTVGLGIPGEFREMGSDVLDSLRGGDLWNAQVRRARNEAQRRRELSEERARENRKEARIDDLAQNIKAQVNPGVSFSDTSWAYRAGARKQ